MKTAVFSSPSPPPPEKPDTAATRPVGLVILGANFGAKIARQLSAAHGLVRVSGVCDLDLEKSRLLAGELDVRAYTDLDHVLADPGVEAVGVFTGPAGRGRLIERIIESGKHVMTTKPFELDPLEAARAFEVAERHDRVLHLNSPSPVPATDLACIRDWLKGADLGRPVALLARTWADYQEQADGSWMDCPVRCPGGSLFRLGVYFINDFAGLLGKPVEVHVQQTRIRTGRPTPDNAQVSIRFESGALANILASFCVRDGQAYRDEVELACERGTIRRWMVRTGDIDMSHDYAVAELQRAGRPVARIQTAPGDYAGWYGWKAFHAAVRGLPGSIRRDAGTAIAGARLLAAVSRATQTGLPTPV